MSGPDPGVVAVSLACCYSLWWCLSLARRLRRIERHSKLDQLTGLGSGDWLDAERWPAALRSGQPLAVVYVDLDHLKWTNDTRGHGAGDQYICTAAQALSQALRRGVDEVFRSHRAGDEFEALLLGPLSDPRGRAESLLRRLSEQGISASLGLAYSTELRFVPARAELRRLAEAACRQAKARGGHCAVVVGPDGETQPRELSPETIDPWRPAAQRQQLQAPRLGPAHTRLTQSELVRP